MELVFRIVTNVNNSSNNYLTFLNTPQKFSSTLVKEVTINRRIAARKMHIAPATL